jgi:hypothetical protein
VATTYDWYKIMYLWMDVTNTAWTALYFISFHLVANVLVFQLTAALFIDAFLSFHDKRWVEGGDETTAIGAGSGAFPPSQAPMTPPGAFGRVGDVGDGRDNRWSYKSEASAAPFAPSPARSEDGEACDDDLEAAHQQRRGQQQQQQQQQQEVRRGASSSPAARRRGPLAPPGALPHSASYTASVI